MKSWLVRFWRKLRNWVNGEVFPCPICLAPCEEITIADLSERYDMTIDQLFHSLYNLPLVRCAECRKDWHESKFVKDRINAR